MSLLIGKAARRSFIGHGGLRLSLFLVFFARISKGCKIQEYVLGALIVPSIM